MPGIYRVSCDSCQFEREAHISVTVLVLDGREEICPHPIERSTAERLGGQGWRQLVAEDRIRYRYALICRGCGAVEYYGVDQLAAYTTPRNMLKAITHEPSEKEAAAFECA